MTEKHVHPFASIDALEDRVVEKIDKATEAVLETTHADGHHLSPEEEDTLFAYIRGLVDAELAFFAVLDDLATEAEGQGAVGYNIRGERFAIQHLIDAEAMRFEFEVTE